MTLAKFFKSLCAWGSEFVNGDSKSTYMIKAKVKTQKKIKTLCILILQSSSSSLLCSVSSGSCGSGPTRDRSEAPIEKMVHCVQATDRTGLT